MPLNLQKVGRQVNRKIGQWGLKLHISFVTMHKHYIPLPVHSRHKKNANFTCPCASIKFESKLNLKCKVNVCTFQVNLSVN
jgi:hypothetical protein